MTEQACASIVSAEWMLAHVHDPTVKVFDASWHMSASGRDAGAEFAQRALPKARFFDIDVICDPHSDLPHTLPSAQLFAQAVADLGIDTGDHVVVYDTVGILSAPRVWWMFRAFGYTRVSVLNGGLPAWQRVGGALVMGRNCSIAAGSFSVADLDLTALAQHYTTIDELKDALESESVTVLDARSEGRFSGREPEPRSQLVSGHMPGALNVPYGHCVDPMSGCLRANQELEVLFERLQLPPNKPLVSSCGSGITACVLALALDCTHRTCRVFDGSWTEWALAGCPIRRKT